MKTNTQTTTTPPPRFAVAYERVSTAEQSTDQQSRANAAYAKGASLPIIQSISETVSGATPWRERQLSRLFEMTPPPQHLLVYELSRTGRNLSDVLNFLEACVSAGITVHITGKGTVIEGGMHGKILAVVLGLAAEIERDHLAERTKAALDERREQIKANGFYISKTGHRRTSLGRQKGDKRPSVLEPQRAAVVAMLGNKISFSGIARTLNVDRKTVAAFAQTIKPEDTTP